MNIFPHVKSRLTQLILTTLITTLSAIGITIYILYDASLEQQKARLIDTVKNQASVVKAITKYNQLKDQIVIQDDPINHALQATLLQLEDAFDSFDGLGETGEFTLASHEGDNIIFLLSHRHKSFNYLQPIPFSSDRAEPMRMALNGKSGTMTGLDYRGEIVLAVLSRYRNLILGLSPKLISLKYKLRLSESF